MPSSANSKFSPLAPCAAAALAAALFGGASTARAQSALGNASPRSITPMPGGSALVVASRANGEATLFRTNGASSACVALREFVASDVVTAPDYLTPTSAGVFFAGDDGTGFGTELWFSDVSAAGTKQVADLHRGSPSSSPRHLTALPAGAVVFSARSEQTGREPWIATPTTVTLLADIAAGSRSSRPADFVRVGSEIFFTARDSQHGHELWATDGTPQGTRLVLDIVPGSGSSSPSGLFSHQGQLWFCANDDTHGAELWRSDGTAAGTQMFADLKPGPGSSQPGDFASFAGDLYFVAHVGLDASQLMRSDGTPAGTGPLLGLGSAMRNPSQLTAAGGQLWFAAETTSAGVELWTSNGSAAGTAQVADIYPGTESSFPDQLTAWGPGEILFVADNGSLGRELWRTSTTTATTSMVVDLWPGPTSGRVTGLARVGSIGLFAGQADDGAGHELYRTDATAAGTERIEDLNPLTEQLSMEVRHLQGPPGLMTLDIVAGTSAITGAIFAPRPGPGLDLNAFGLPSYGLLEVWPNEIEFGILLLNFGGTASGTAGIQVQFPSSLDWQYAVQGVTLNPTVFSGLTSFSNGTWNTSGCPTCANVPFTTRAAIYVDDTYEYDFAFDLASSSTDLWLRLVRVPADGDEQEVVFQPIRPGTSRLRGQVELRRRERLEVRVYCGDPAGNCYIRKVLGC